MVFCKQHFLKNNTIFAKDNLEVLKMQRFIYFLKNCRNAVLQQPVGVAVVNFLLAMLLYTVSRLFFVAVNAAAFPNLTIGHLYALCVGGLRFDLSALLYINAVYLVLEILPFRFRYNAVYQKVANGFYLACNILGILTNCVDMMYFQYTHRRTTCSFFSEFGGDDNLLRIVGLAIVQYWYVTLFAFLAVALLVWWQAKLRWPSVCLRRSFYYPLHSLVMLAVVYLSIIGIRGGFGAYTRPINISNAAQYTQSSIETAIVLNTPFSLIQTIQPVTYVNPHYYADETSLQKAYTPVHTAQVQGEFNPLNVVVIILESFSKEYVGFFNHDLDSGTYQGYTPFLDSLLVHSMTFKYSFATGRKSIDAMPSTLSGIPSFVEPYVTTSYANNDIASIASYLKKKGYYTAFFHGAPNSSMGFQAYARAAGFEDYLGMDNYPDKKDFDGTWAIWDEEFLQFFADEMGTFRQPFVTTVFTASSHHPFRVPERYAGVFPQGTHPIHQCIAYSDNALRMFFGKMAQYDWFKNTLFVLTADHTNALTHAEYRTAKGEYEIPICFYRPQSDLCGLSEHIVQQTDITPTILEYMQYDEPYFAFGKNVLDTAANNYAVQYNNGIYQYFTDSLLIMFDGKQTTAVYDFKHDRMLSRNLSGVVNTEEQEQTLKAVIQQYMQRMIENRLLENR